MTELDGTRTFQAPADAYDAFMGRYSRALAPATEARAAKA